MGTYRIFEGETVTVMPQHRCECGLRSGRCDGRNDVVVPALWHKGRMYSGVVAAILDDWTVAVDHNGERDFVPYDCCVQS